MNRYIQDNSPIVKRSMWRETGIADVRIVKTEKFDKQGNLTECITVTEPIIYEVSEDGIRQVMGR